MTFRPWSYREPANDVTFHVNSQGSDGIAFVAVPPREPDGTHVQYGIVVPTPDARDLADAILKHLGPQAEPAKPDPGEVRDQLDAAVTAALPLSGRSDGPFVAGLIPVDFEPLHDEPPATPAADLADEAAYERVARAIHQHRWEDDAADMWGYENWREYAYAAARAAIDAYRAGQPSEHVAYGAIALLASGLRNRASKLLDHDTTDPQTIVSAALGYIDNLSHALDEATQDELLEAELDGGLPVDEQRRVEALHIGANAINGAQWSEDFNNAVSALLAEAPRIEDYIRDGDQGVSQREFAAGYAEAIRRLRDRDRYETWYAQNQYPQGAPQRPIFSPTASRGLAEYLESTAPDPNDPWVDAALTPGAGGADGR